jgi:N,N'-diacetylchitobiose transport system permease protein
MAVGLQPARRRGRTAPAAPAPAPAARRRRLSAKTFDDTVLPWLLLAPAFLIMGGLVLWPLVQTVWLSFTDAGVRWLRDGEADFVGLENYAAIVSDPLLRRVFLTTAVFGLLCVAGTMVVGLLAALVLNQRFPGRAVVAVAALLPWAMPPVAAGAIWRWLFDDRYGLVNWLLPGPGFVWFNQRSTAFLAIGIVVIWQSFPFVAMSLLAGFQSIPDEVQDAAKVDGANALQRLRHLTLPMLRPLLVVLVIISTIWDFKIFDQVFVMTRGGPARSTEVIALTTYSEAFGDLQFGSAGALAVSLFVVLVLVTLLYLRALRKEDGT